MNRSPQARPISAPVAVLPVNDIFCTRRSETSALPASAPNPVTTLTTPGGKPACSSSSTSSRREAEVCSDGLMTMVLPGGERRSQLGGGQHQRRVPRGDRTADTQRLTHRVVEQAAARPGDDVALDLVGEPGVVVVVLRQGRHLGAHLAEQLAVVEGLGAGQQLGVLGDQVTEPAEQASAPGLGQVAPGRVLEGRLGRADGPVDVGGAAARGLVDRQCPWWG